MNQKGRGVLPIMIALLIGALPIIFVPLQFSVREVVGDSVQSNVLISVCNNDIVDFDEVCDQTPNLGGYGSSTAERKCEPGCDAFAPYCGDGILQVRFSEECDDSNNTNGDLCDASCQSETPAPPAPNGTPTRGPIPDNPNATPGNIDGDTQTKVVLRGKAYPNATVKILLDGKSIGTTQADVAADFLYTTTEITPGTATFGFVAEDIYGVSSITTSVVFDVVQSAITTVANIFFPPTIRVNSSRVESGGLLQFEGQTVPNARVTTEIGGTPKSSLEASSNVAGLWALQVNTASLSDGAHTAKSFFKISDAIRSGWGRSVNFTIGEGPSACTGETDINGDEKVNLVDFSIFLTDWNTDKTRSDFNCDSRVNLSDFSIMLFNWTG